MTGIFVAWSDNPRSPGWVENGAGCHIWVGANVRGYGQVQHEGKVQYVHRVRYEMEVGPIPQGMELDHFVCDNGSAGCCNPQHCRPVTPRENQLRSTSFSSVNAAKSNCPRGHALEGDNLSTAHLRRGKRACNICKREALRRWRSTQREAVSA